MLGFLVSFNRTHKCQSFGRWSAALWSVSPTCQARAQTCSFLLFLVAKRQRERRPSRLLAPPRWLGFMLIRSDTDLWAVNRASGAPASLPSHEPHSCGQVQAQSASCHYYARRAAWLIPKRAALLALGEPLRLDPDDGWTGPLWNTPKAAALPGKPLQLRAPHLVDLPAVNTTNSCQDSSILQIYSCEDTLVSDSVPNSEEFMLLWHKDFSMPFEQGTVSAGRALKTRGHSFSICEQSLLHFLFKLLKKK